MAVSVAVRSRRVEIPVARRAGVSQSKFVSAQDLKNLYLERTPDGQEALFTAPALSAFAAFTGGPVRGVIAFANVILAVSAGTLYSVTQAGTVTTLGAISGTGQVVMANNGFEVSIVSDSESYLWDGTTLSMISDADFLVASSVTFIAQYLAYSEQGTGRFFLSGLADGSAYSATDRATAESTPDNLVRVFADSGDLMLAGVETIEPWANTGDADFPFQRVGAVINLGLLGRDAIAVVDNSFAFLASDRTVRILRGATPLRISDHDIERIIAGWDDPQTSRAFSAVVGGHPFWFLWNPQGCVCWDAATGFWHQRATREQPTWRGHCAVTIWNETYVGDAFDGALYRLAEGVYNETRELVSYTVGVGGAPFTVDSLEIEIEPGVGISSGQGSEPEVWLQLSRDGGYTYGARITRRIGARGVRPKTIRWNCLGQFPRRGGVFKLGCSDPVALTVMKAWADVTADAP